MYLDLLDAEDVISPEPFRADSSIVAFDIGILLWLEACRMP